MMLENCKIIQNGRETECDILIEDGKIKKIGHNIYDSGKRIDLGGLHVLPGLIDPHVHFREPGLTHKEDFLSGSKAAAAGGITTVLDMPNTVPPTITVELLEHKRELAKKSLVNFGFHFGAAADNIDEIKKAKNVASTKVFMNLSTGKMMIKDDKALKEVFAASKIVTVHAEGKMVDKAIRLSKECKNRLYLCHISQRSELETIRAEKTDRIYAEATPHHLFLSEQDDRDSFTKMIPGLKSVMDREALFAAVKDRLIDTIGTDHAPHTTGEKLSEEYPHGVPGCETMLPLLLNAVNDGDLSLARVQELCCHNPAKIFRIKNKGFLLPGYDADIVVIDMDLAKEVDEEELFTKCGWSPFQGWTLMGWPVMTIVNGNIVFNDGDIDETHKGKEVEFG